MSSSCIVEVCRIGTISEHTNSDNLELCIIKGWQAVIPKGRYREGDLVVYIPIDTVIPQEWSDKWGVTQYLSKGRVKCAKLRGEPSFGLIISVDEIPVNEGEELEIVEGMDVRERFGITKYIPPFKPTCDDAESPHPLLVRYTDIENMRNFPEVLQEGEEIVITEKLHGTNAKIARIEGEWMAGSMTVRRKMPTDGSLLTSLYWYPLTLPGVKELLEGLEQAGHSQAILYGEVVGSKVQNLSYGFEGALGFRAFDILVDGKYLDYDTFDITCRHFGIETVPLLYRGPFSLDVVKNLSSGKTVLQASHIREGVVVKPVVERIDPKVGRVVLKYISDEYLFGKEKGKVTDTEDI